MGSNVNSKCFESAATISADGNTLAVSSSTHSENGANSGYIKIYRYSDGSWNKLGSSIYGSTNSFFGTSVSLSSDGNIVSSGGEGYDSFKGFAQVYKFNDSSWEKIGNDI